MKHFFSTLALVATTVAAPAQNVQLHYDLGHSLYNDLGNRPSVTTTVEMFKPDTWGSTYLFTDIDYQRDGVAGAYWEIAREFNVTKNKQWAFHVEYNGGLNSDEDTWNVTRFQHAVLAGGAWNWHSADFSRTFSVQALWKYYFKNRHYGARPFNGFQLTEVWGIQFAKGFCTFSGFCDLWYDPSANGKWIVISEPQFWWNLNKFKGWEKINLSVGTEWELSNNFVWNDKGEHNRFYFIPTIAAKWTF
ncbi:nucleoside-specific channel-forming Tsx family protein [Segatella buccae]|uniref:nucleoside-specific channel-forming Tsx family protein n=1 Tax=Segatella buccae TaxID=28126 RepID=UPI003FD7A4D3